MIWTIRQRVFPPGRLGRLSRRGEQWISPPRTTSIDALSPSSRRPKRPNQERRLCSPVTTRATPKSRRIWFSPFENDRDFSRFGGVPRSLLLINEEMLVAGRTSSDIVVTCHIDTLIEEFRMHMYQINHFHLYASIAIVYPVSPRSRTN